MKVASNNGSFEDWYIRYVVFEFHVDDTSPNVGRVRS